MRYPSSRLALLVAGLSCVGVARGACPAVAAGPDRQQIQSMLIESGYSGVASLRLVHAQWVGIGAHDGTVVAFVVDAASGRLVSEVEAR